MKHIFTTTFENTYNGPEPGKNTYKNYFQLYVPAEAQFEGVLVDGKRTDYEVWPRQDLAAPSVYVEVPPQSQKKVTLIYTTPDLVKTGIDSTYELTVQKQIGIEESDMRFTITLPKGSSLLSKSFDAEIRGSSINHTDRLDQDSSYKIQFTAP
jgi:hypothetical protein